MKLYRYVTKEELDDIRKYHRLKFIHPRYMAMSESLITNYFEMNRILEDTFDEKKAKKKIRLLVEKYRQSDIHLKNISDYDMFSEIVLMWYITNFYYCHCWTKDKDAWDIRKDDRIACITIDTANLDKCVCKDVHDNIYNMYLRYQDINYHKSKGQKSLETLFQEFKDSDRKAYTLMTILPERFEYQNEVRLIASYKENTRLLGIYTLGTLGNYLMRKYSLNEILDPENDLIDALFLEAKQCQIEIKTSLINTLYFYFPEDFIEDISYNPKLEK